MKKLMKISAGFLVAAVLAGGLLLPDVLFRFLDAKSVAVQSEDLPQVTLDLAEELTLCQKADIAAEEGSGVFLSSNQASRTQQEVMEKARGILAEIGLEMHTSDQRLSLEFVNLDVVLFVSRDSGQTAVFWDVYAYYGDLYLNFLLDDEALDLVGFYLENTAYEAEDTMISEDMYLLAERVLTILSRQFGNASWQFEDSESVSGENDVILETYKMTAAEKGITHSYKLQYTDSMLAFNTMIH